MTKKEVRNSFLIFILVTLFGTTLNFNNQVIGLDRMWLFMEAKKMTEGLLIYRDFNVIIGPAFYVIYSLFMKVFGINYFAGDIYAGVQCGVTAVLVYLITLKLNKQKNPLITLTMLLVSIYYVWLSLCANYNMMLLHMVLIALLLEIVIIQGKEKWYLHFFIGLALGVGFLTKQTVGGIVLVGMCAFPIINDLWIRKENPTKKVAYRIIGAMLVILAGFGIMLVRGNFLDYVDICFGGIFEFGQKNSVMMNALGQPALMVGILLACIPLVPKFKNKSEILAIIVYECACITYIIPIGNTYHLSLAVFLVWFLVIPIIELLYEDDKKQIANLVMVIMMVAQMFYILNQPEASGSAADEDVSIVTFCALLYYQIVMKVLLCAWAWALVKERPSFLKFTYVFCGVFSILFFLFTFNQGLKENPNSEGFAIYANHGFYESELKEIKDVVEYVNQKEEEGFNTLLISAEAAKYTSAIDRNQNKYDLFLSGNLGFNGTKKCLNEIKNMHNTLIFKEKDDFWQEPKLIMEYVTETLPLYDEFGNFEIYIKE